MNINTRLQIKIIKESNEKASYVCYLEIRRKLYDLNIYQPE